MSDTHSLFSLSDGDIAHWRSLATDRLTAPGITKLDFKVFAWHAANWGWERRTPEVEAAHEAGYEEACAMLESLGDTRTANLIRKRRVQTTPQQQALAGLRCINDVTDGSEVVIPRHLLELTITALEEQTND